jgi:hypothetical protein
VPNLIEKRYPKALCKILRNSPLDSKGFVYFYLQRGILFHTAKDGTTDASHYFLWVFVSILSIMDLSKINFFLKIR